jgi:hypothetical protein
LPDTSLGIKEFKGKNHEVAFNVLNGEEIISFIRHLISIPSAKEAFQKNEN